MNRKRDDVLRWLLAIKSWFNAELIGGRFDGELACVLGDQDEVRIVGLGREWYYVRSAELTHEGRVRFRLHSTGPIQPEESA